MNQPKISIIILNWNGLSDTIECLESLTKITYPNYEVFVVDNGSKGKEADVIGKKYSDFIKLIRNDNNYGFAEGNNIAIRWVMDNSNPDYFLLLNNDTTVDPKFLDEMIEIAEKDTKVGIVGPKTYFYQMRNRLQLVWFKVDMYRGEAKHVGSLSYDEGQYENITSVDYMQGSCLLIKKTVLLDVGLLDSKFFCYWEEADYCFRVKQAGYKIIYAPKAKIWHKKLIDTNPWYKKVFSANKVRISNLVCYYITRNNFWFMKKHANKIQRCVFILYFFTIRFWFNSCVYLLYYHDYSLLRSYLNGVRDGMFGYAVMPKP